MLHVREISDTSSISIQMFFSLFYSILCICVLVYVCVCVYKKKFNVLYMCYYTYTVAHHEKERVGCESHLESQRTNNHRHALAHTNE